MKVREVHKRTAWSDEPCECTDQLTFIAVKDRRFYPVFKYTFCPTYHFIDRATGYFNSAMEKLLSSTFR